MKTRVRRVAAGALLLALPVCAQTFPTKPVRLLVPFAPGGGNDIIARMLAQRIADVWQQQMVVDNRPGAGGNVAAEITARAAPDGHTLFQFNIANAMAPGVYQKLGYDPQKDFAPITAMASSPFILTVHPAVKAGTVKEFIALAKSQPARLNYASSGTGGSTHLITELFASLAQVKLTHIPYNGAGPALTELIGGQTQVMFLVPATAMPHIRTGKLRGLGLSSAQRSALVPDLPTVAEAGVPGFDAGTWYGLVAPARTPPAIVARLHRDFVGVLKSTEVRERLTSQGVDLIANSPEEFGRFISNEITKWIKVARESGARAE